MTTDLEKQFFIAFGIEPTHEDACKLADKYWGNEELAEKYYVFDRYIEKNCPIGGKECFSTCKYAYDNIEYPQITDRILLELICFNNRHYVTLEDLICPKNIETIKESVLKKFIKRNKEFVDNGYSGFCLKQVQALFKEE